MSDIEKSKLLREWLRPWLHTSIRLMNAGQVPPDPTWSSRLQPSPDYATEEFIYVLLTEDGSDGVPVYIGRAKNPVARWKSHLQGFATGKRSYRRWRERLLDERGHSRYPLVLVVIPICEVTIPVIPGFPTTVGALEYQLISLAAEVTPGGLLNHEGIAR